MSNVIICKFVQNKAERFVVEMYYYFVFPVELDVGCNYLTCMMYVGFILCVELDVGCNYLTCMSN